MRSRPLGRRTRRSVTAATIGVASLVFAACGSDDDSNSATPEVVIDGAATAADETDSTDATADAASSDATDEELALEFAQCMRDEGLDWPDPTTNADGSLNIFGDIAAGGRDQADDATIAAFEVCGSLLEGTTFLPGADGLDVEMQDTLVEFAQCLRDEGIDAEDPDFSGFADAGGQGGAGGAGALFGDDFDADDPATQAAFDACEQVLTDGGIDPAARGQGS